jgi:hypothetical protein
MHFSQGIHVLWYQNLRLLAHLLFCHCHFVEVPQFSVHAQVRLEVMGKKAKNATYLCGNEAGKISREVAKVEKRRTVKSTLCNERSSRSHCMVGCIQSLGTLLFLKLELFMSCLSFP